jgi:hypothetical protein
MGSPSPSRSPWWKNGSKDALADLGVDAGSAVVDGDPDVLRTLARHDPHLSSLGRGLQRVQGRFITTCRSRSSSPCTWGKSAGGSRSSRTPRGSASPTNRSVTAAISGSSSQGHGALAPRPGELQEVLQQRVLEAGDLVAHQLQRSSRDA